MRLHQVNIVGNGLLYGPQLFLWLNCLRFLRFVSCSYLLSLQRSTPLLCSQCSQQDQRSPYRGSKSKMQTGDKCRFVQQDNQPTNNRLCYKQDTTRQCNPGLSRSNLAPAPGRYECPDEHQPYNGRNNRGKNSQRRAQVRRNDIRGQLPQDSQPTQHDLYNQQNRGNEGRH